MISTSPLFPPLKDGPHRKDVFMKPFRKRRWVACGNAMMDSVLYTNGVAGA